MEERVTLVVGASPEPTRYSHLATLRLNAHGYPVQLFGKRVGTIAGEPIHRTLPTGLAVHTITLYIAPAHQADLMDDLLALRPTRIIFNPGTENANFRAKAELQGVEVLEACTLVMLSTGQY